VKGEEVRWYGMGRKDRARQKGESDRGGMKVAWDEEKGARVMEKREGERGGRMVVWDEKEGEGEVRG
jgi:hypothetical protein